PARRTRSDWVDAAVKADEALSDLKRRLEQRPDEDPIELVPAGFRLRGGQVEPLAGKPLAVLRALLGARHWRLSAGAIRRAVWPADTITHPDQAVKDAAGDLRQALRQALRRAGARAPGDPLPSQGRGADLAYQLDLSVLQKR